MKLINYMEIIAQRYVDKWMSQSGVCGCEECKLDVMAIMLNRLKPKYVVSEKGRLFAQLAEFDKQHKVDIMTALSAAVEIVKKNPRRTNCADCAQRADKALV